MKLSTNNPEVREMWRLTYAAMATSGCTSETCRKVANKAAAKYQKQFHSLEGTAKTAGQVDKEWLKEYLTELINNQREQSRSASGSENKAKTSLAIISELEHLIEVCCNG